MNRSNRNIQDLTVALQDQILQNYVKMFTIYSLRMRRYRSHVNTLLNDNLEDWIELVVLLSIVARTQGTQSNKQDRNWLLEASWDSSS